MALGCRGATRNGIQLDAVSLSYLHRVLHDNPGPWRVSRRRNCIILFHPSLRLVITHNLKLSSLLKERAEDPDAAGLTQNAILSDQSDVPYWPLTSLEKPRVGCIREVMYSVIFVRLSPSVPFKNDI